MSLNPIAHNGMETLSFRQIDALNGFGKGTAFRLFKQWRAALIEGQHYFYLSSVSRESPIDTLRRDGRIYRNTRQPVHTHDLGVRTERQPDQEVTAIAFNAIEQLIAEVAPIEQQQSTRGPRAQVQSTMVSRPLVRQLHTFEPLPQNAHD